MKSEYITIYDIALVIQQKINTLYRENPKHQVFNQKGFINCFDIINDYLLSGEHALAIDHLLYVVNENDTHSLKEFYGTVSKMAEEYEVPNKYIE